MNRTFVGALVGAIGLVGITAAEEIPCYVTKIGDGHVTFVRTKFNKETKKLERGEPATLPVASGVKVSKAVFDKDVKKIVSGDAVEGGLRNEAFTMLDP